MVGSDLLFRIILNSVHIPERSKVNLRVESSYPDIGLFMERRSLHKAVILKARAVLNISLISRVRLCRYIADISIPSGRSDPGHICAFISDGNDNRISATDMHIFQLIGFSRSRSTCPYSRCIFASSCLNFPPGYIQAIEVTSESSTYPRATVRSGCFDISS